MEACLETQSKCSNGFSKISISWLFHCENHFVWPRDNVTWSKWIFEDWLWSGTEIIQANDREYDIKVGPVVSSWFRIDRILVREFVVPATTLEASKTLWHNSIHILNTLAPLWGASETWNPHTKIAFMGNQLLATCRSLKAEAKDLTSLQSFFSENDQFLKKTWSLLKLLFRSSRKSWFEK